MEMLQFISGIVLLVVVVGICIFKSPSLFIDHLKNEKSITKGILLVVLIVPLIAIIIEKAAASSFNYAYAYAGMDYGKKRLPMCESGGVNDRLTSNVGFGLNLYQAPEKKFYIDAKYTHHSCAYSGDYWDYDAIGLELMYKINFR